MSLKQCGRLCFAMTATVYIPSLRLFLHDYNAPFLNPDEGSRLPQAVEYDRMDTIWHQSLGKEKKKEWFPPGSILREVHSAEANHHVAKKTKHFYTEAV